MILSPVSITGLTEGIYDVGLVGMNADEESLECIPFGRDRLVSVMPVSEQYSEKELTAEEVRSLLLHENLVLRREGSARRMMVDRILDVLNIDERTLRIGARINDQETIKNLAECGYGITIVFERVVADRGEKESSAPLGAKELPVSATCI